MPAIDRVQAKEHALELAFEGRWSHAEMAARVGVSTRTIERWVRAPDFRTRLDMMRADLAASLRDVAYAHKSERIVGLAQMAEHARREYERRPLLVERRPVGRDSETGEPLILEHEAFNRDAHEAFRKSLDDIAKELGERGSNVRVTGSITQSIVPTGAAAALADELLAAVGDIPEARARIAARLITDGLDSEGQDI